MIQSSTDRVKYNLQIRIDSRRGGRGPLSSFCRVPLFLWLVAYLFSGNPGVYSFNYDVSDDATGNNQYRTEDRYANGTVRGAYGYVDAFGTPQRFRYVADQAGYR